MKLKFFTFSILLSVGAYAAPVDPLANFFRDKSKIDKPFELRDPFKVPVLKSDKSKSKPGFTMSGKGQYTNIEENTVSRIEDIRVVGVLIGRERRAMVSTGKDKGGIIILKEGMKIGDEGAELKAILPGGIILVEKMTNVYGQEEYLETVIPISK